MATGRATTFAVENHEGMLYSLSPTDTKFLSMLGGMFGGEPIIGSVVIPWQEYSLRAPDVRARTEGADAQTATHATRSPVHNVLQIKQETVDTSYTKRATSAMLAAIGSNHPNVATTGQGNPVGDEHDWQLETAFKEYARDLEHVLLQGDFVEPSDNNSARQTRGIIAATTTNHTDVAVGATAVTGTASADTINAADLAAFNNDDKVQFTALTGGAGLETGVTYYVVNRTDGTPDTLQLAVSLGGTPIDFTTDISAATLEVVADLTEDTVLATMQLAYDNGGLMEEESSLVLVNSWNKRRLSDIFITQKNYQEMSREVGGVRVTTILTDFGELNVAVDRFMPKNTLQVVSMEECKVCFLVLDDGTKIRVEELAKDGARDRTQVYFEFGLRYGNELRHAKITGLSTR